MASKRDLVEANSFNRRRLVTAFVSGAPGGREVDPQSPGRAVVAGVVLAALVVGGSALAGVLKPTLPADWGDNSLVVGKESGARYLAVDERLYPVLNTVSARLLVDPGQFKVVFAPESELAEKPHGPTIGIVGAPEGLPDDDRLVQTGWTSCLDGRGRTRTTIAAGPPVTGLGPDAAVVVVAGGTPYVVTAGHRYRVDGDLDSTVLALEMEGQPVLEAPGTWADLFPAGSPLDGVQVPEAGQPAPAVWDLPPEAATLGSVLEVTGDDGEPRRYLLSDRGRVLLTETAYELYQVAAGDLAEPVPVDKSDLTAAPEAGAGQRPYPADWPAQLPTPVAETTVCAQLQAGAGTTRPEVGLALPRTTLPGGEAAVDPLPGTGTGDDAVEPGAGALVRAVSGGKRGTVFLVDSSGTRYALGGVQHSGTFVQEQLGYVGVEPTTVLPAWLEALPTGPELSPVDASRRVSASPRGGR